MSNRPYIGDIKPYTWNRLNNGECVPGLLIGGRIGIAAHVTKTEAYALADWIVDAADKLPDSTPTATSADQE